MDNPTIKNHSNKIIGYKAMKKDSKGYYTDGMGNGIKVYWEIGQTKSVENNPSLCQNGFHFFRYLCFAIDYLQPGNFIFEIESLGDVQEDTEKCVTNKIKIIKRISKTEIKKMINVDRNAGYRNAGYRNAGNRNAGNRNAGDENAGDENAGNENAGYRNAGYRNAGYRNAGNENAGNENAGYRNAGDRNAGDRNTGDRNTGDRNTGNGNAGDFNSGNGYKNCFCTQTKYFLFDIEVKEEIIDKLNEIDLWSWFELEEQGIEGYKKAWSKCPEEKLKELKKIPEFRLKKNKIKFEEITGLKF